MTCSYCRYLNSDEERRCRRCGRPLADTYAMVTNGALAALPQPARSEPARAPVASPVARPMAPGRQGSLFSDKPTGKVVPFEAWSTPVLEPQPAPKPKAPRSPARTQSRRAAVPNEAQPALDFLQPAPAEPRKLATSVEAVIYCDAPVAAPMHRAFAAAIDASMVVIACGLFLTVFHLLGGVLNTGKITLLLVGSAMLLIAMFYGFVSAWSGGLTIGMRATHLTLIDFDGFPPDRAARWLRFVGSCLSYCACGLGILWALVDEESLAWHDHISKTFPTFRGPATNFVRRR